ncbi:MAG: radical SAM protein [Elusimicrobiota bacterium]
MIRPEPNVFLTDRCNQRCLFCSTSGEDRVQRAEEIEACILANRRTISLEGGEPALSRDLLKWIRFARGSGTKDIILCTNGAALGSERSTRRLLDAGVTLFNVNFPSHIERVFDLLTQTRGLFRSRVAGMRRLVRLAGGERVRLTLVVNRLNCDALEGYARFVRREFPGVFYIAMNWIKVKGRVKDRPYLVPRLSRVRPRLAEALDYCRRSAIRCLVDGVPLCLLEGYEEHSIDFDKLRRGDRTYLGEKAHARACRGCSLRGVCAGPRRDYLEMFGDGELRPRS